MEEIKIKLDIPAEFKEEFTLALNKIVKQLLKQMKLSIFEKISGIDESDKREVKQSVVDEVVKSAEETSRKIASGKIKPRTIEEFNSWCDSV